MEMVFSGNHLVSSVKCIRMQSLAVIEPYLLMNAGMLRDAHVSVSGSTTLSVAKSWSTRLGGIVIFSLS